jgi:hypothetical protein
MKQFLRQMSSREALALIGFGIAYYVVILLFLHSVGH